MLKGKSINTFSYLKFSLRLTGFYEVNEGQTLLKNSLQKANCFKCRLRKGDRLINDSNENFSLINFKKQSIIFSSTEKSG